MFVLLDDRVIFDNTHSKIFQAVIISDTNSQQTFCFPGFLCLMNFSKLFFWVWVANFTFMSLVLQNPQKGFWTHLHGKQMSGGLRSVRCHSKS